MHTVLHLSAEHGHRLSATASSHTSRRELMHSCMSCSHHSSCFHHSMLLPAGFAGHAAARDPARPGAATVNTRLQLCMSVHYLPLPAPGVVGSLLSMQLPHARTVPSAPKSMPAGPAPHVIRASQRLVSSCDHLTSAGARVSAPSRATSSSPARQPCRSFLSRVSRSA